MEKAVNKTPASPDLPQADPVSEVMALATKMMRDSWATGNDAHWQPAYAALEAKVRELEKDAARMRKALDNLYNHNAATRAAVIFYYGVNHYFDTRDAAIDSARAAQKPEASNGR